MTTGRCPDCDGSGLAYDEDIPISAHNVCETCGGSGSLGFQFCCPACPGWDGSDGSEAPPCCEQVLGWSSRGTPP